MSEVYKKSIKRGGDYCSAIGCHNSRNNCSLSLFKFPKDIERLVKITSIYHYSRHQLEDTLTFH